MVDDDALSTPRTCFFCKVPPPALLVWLSILLDVGFFSSRYYRLQLFFTVSHFKIFQKRERRHPTQLCLVKLSGFFSVSNFTSNFIPPLSSSIVSPVLRFHSSVLLFPVFLHLSPDQPCILPMHRSIQATFSIQ